MGAQSGGLAFIRLSETTSLAVLAVLVAFEHRDRSPGSCDRSEFRGASNRRPSWQGSLRYPRSERRKNSLVEFSSQFRASGQETLKMQDECSNHEDGAGAGARGGGNTDAGEGWHG